MKAKFEQHNRPYDGRFFVAKGEDILYNTKR